MCTALALETKDGYNLFGRNMDIEYSFNHSIHLVPRKFAYKDNVTGEMKKTKYAIIGMGTLFEGYPAFAYGLNEKGLACAGLNFPGYAYYEDKVIPNKINLAPYDLILWILSNFETVDEVRKEIKNVNIVKKPFNEFTPLPTLHWMVSDKDGNSIVIEKTKEKLSVYENKVGVLTNSPTFDWHITNLRQYMGISSLQPENTVWNNQELTPLGQGLGSMGIPGDFSTVSRFVRTAFFKSRINTVSDLERGIIEFFHILNNVAMVNGAVRTQKGKNDITLYTSCMCQQKGIYYYNTYYNNRINAIDMNKEYLDAKEIKIFNYRDTLDINYEN